MEIEEYSEILQNDLENFLETIYSTRGLEYQPDGLQSDTRMIRQVYFKDGGFFWVVRDGNTIIGCIALKILNLKLQIGEVKRYFVLPSFQNAGIGTNLLEKLIAKAQESGLTALRLDTMRKSAKALSIFSAWTKTPVFRGAG